MEDQGYSAVDACRIVGITYRQADYWARTGIVASSIASAKGSGSRRRYSYLDLLHLRLVAALNPGASASLHDLRQLILSTDWLDEVAFADGLRLVLDIQGKVAVALDDADLLDLLRSGCAAYHVVDLGSIKAEVDAAIARYHCKSRLVRT